MKKCFLCGSTEFYPFFKDINEIRACSCGLVFHKSIPTERIIKRLVNARPRVLMLSDSPIEYGDCCKRLEKIEKYKQTGKILDVGAGNSNFLAVAKNSGWDVYGNDIDLASIRLQKGLGHKIIEIKDIPNGSMDVITMYHVLEHVPDPIELLFLLGKKMKRNGLIYIDVPNVKGLGVRLFGEKSSYINLFPGNGGHVFYYNASTIKRLLKKTGFDVININYKGGAALQQVADVKEKITGSRTIENWYTYAKPLALIFMRLLSLFRLSDSIEIIAMKN